MLYMYYENECVLETFKSSNHPTCEWKWTRRGTGIYPSSNHSLSKATYLGMGLGRGTRRICQGRACAMCPAFTMSKTLWKSVVNTSRTLWHFNHCSIRTRCRTQAELMYYVANLVHAVNEHKRIEVQGQQWINGSILCSPKRTHTRQPFMSILVNRLGICLPV